GLACEPNRVSLQVLGSGGPELNDQRASSSYLIWINNKATLLVDTGTGSAINFEKAGAHFRDIQAILYTHLHVDHSADLPAYVKGSYFISREDLSIYGPKGNPLMPSTSEFINLLFGDQGAYRYLSNFVDPAKKSDYKILVNDVELIRDKFTNFTLSDEISITAVPVNHGPVAAIAWRVNAYGCSLTFSGDMSNRFNTLVELATDSHILIAHNAIPEHAKGVARLLHMPPSEIGKIANDANVKMLILSHQMKRTIGKEAETVAIIHKYYDGPVEFAGDMDLFELNYSE
ncbi:MAG: MBL fold metallo-hydrolase, partial [Pseudomonadota bacterium]